MFLNNLLGLFLKRELINKVKQTNDVKEVRRIPIRYKATLNSGKLITNPKIKKHAPRKKIASRNNKREIFIRKKIRFLFSFNTPITTL